MALYPPKSFHLEAYRRPISTVSNALDAHSKAVGILANVALLPNQIIQKHAERAFSL